jgi:putative hydrolase of the HAD superfamily
MMLHAIRPAVMTKMTAAITVKVLYRLPMSRPSVSTASGAHAEAVTRMLNTLIVLLGGAIGPGYKLGSTDLTEGKVMTRQYDALIVDYGGVLTTPLQESMIRFAQETGIELQDLVRAALGAYVDVDDELIVAFETGRISEDEFSEAFARRLSDATGVAVESEGLIRRIFAGLELEEAMVSALKSTRAAGFKTGLLSNSWGMSLYPRQLLDELFDAVVVSGDVGMRKPDPAIFALITQKLGAVADRCVLVDDYPGHLESAATAGMTTVLHRSPAETIAELERLFEVPLV